jgi:hypothetical protein
VSKHFSHLSPDIHERLAARGIDPDHSLECWLAAIRTRGGFQIDDYGLPIGPLGRPWRRHPARVAARYSLTPIPYAIVVGDGDER